MATLSAAEREAIAQRLAKLDVDGAFAALAKHPELKQADLPALDKKQLAALGADRDATRRFVAGLLHASASVRRMARRFASKLQPHGPGALLLLAVEAVRPFRKVSKAAPGLAGEFGGCATPLGPAILDAKLSWKVSNPTVAVYSPASRLLKDACDDLAAVLAQLPDPELLLAYEYLAAIRRPFARVENFPLPADAPGLAEAGIYASCAILLEGLEGQLRARAIAASPPVLRAFERWARHELLLDLDAAAGSPAALARARWHEAPEAERRASAAILPACAGRLLERGLPAELALRLYQHLKAGPKPPTAAHEWVMSFVFARYAQSNPREAAAKLPSPLPPLAPPEAGAPPAKATRKKADAPAAPAAEPAADLPVPLDPCTGPPVERALAALIPVAHHLGLPDAWRELVKECEHDWLGDDDAPQANKKAPEEAVQALAAARAAIGDRQTRSKQRDQLAGGALGSFSQGEGPYVPEAALDAPWADRLAAVVVELPPGHALTVALTLLPPRLLAKHAAAWRAAASKLEERTAYGPVEELVTAVATRGPGLAPAAGPLLEWKLAQHPPAGDNQADFALAVLYGAHGAEGRAAAARALAAAKLPERGSYYKAHTSGRGLRWLVRRAWEARDAELLSAAVARLCLPLYFKGKRALLPDGEPRFRMENMAPVEGTAAKEREVPLVDVLAFVAQARPDRLAEGLAAAGERAAFEKGCRALLDAAPEVPAQAPKGAAPEGEARRVDDVVALLEAPDPPVVKSGLEMLVDHVPALGPRLDEVLRGVERAVGSTSPGVVQAAAALLGAIGAGHPDRRDDAVRLLEECLMSRNVPTAEAALRALAQVLVAAAPAKKKKAPGKSKKKSAAGLSDAARERLAELAKDEPRRLGPLVAALS